MRFTKEQIEAGKTAKGGFSREQLALWGVKWPPKKGWRKQLEMRSPKTKWRPQQEQDDSAEKERQSMRELYLEKSGWDTFGEVRGE